MIFHSIVNCIYASYKTLPVWSGRILTFLVKVKNTSLEVRTTAKVAQFRKETRSKDKKANCHWHKPVHACLNQYSPLPLRLLYLTSSNQGPDPMAWQAPSQDGLLLPWL